MNPSNKHKFDEANTQNKIKETRGKSIFPNTLYPLLIYAILKVHSSKDKPLTSNAITAYMEQWIDGNYDSELLSYEDPVTHRSKYASENNTLKTVRNYLNSFTGINETGYAIKGSGKNLSEYPILTQMALYMSACFCGTIRITDSSVERNRTYYFDPFLSDSDISMFTGTVITSPYFTDDEKTLLLQLRPLLNGGERLRIWASNYAHSKAGDDSQNVFDIFPNTTRRTPDNSRILKNIEILYEIIKSKSPNVIRITYGRYGAGTDAYRRATLDDKNQPEQQDLELNPYGLVWRRGYCYLITSDYTTKNKPVQIRHRRIDRILSIEVINSKFRQPVPDILSSYFKDNYFHPDEYVAEHPMMSRYLERNIVVAELECDNMTSSIILDAFGTNVKLVESKLIERTTAIWSGKKLTNLTATVKAQYEDILEFCIEFHKSIYVTDKKSKLFNDVKNIVQKSYNWYNS
ncbi:MAG: WYL domain-containing protein [Lachnospiraceae bacterium]|nr:WYL domain-containing protein [Lachnospiraceae bacterium]